MIVDQLRHLNLFNYAKEINEEFFSHEDVLPQTIYFAPQKIKHLFKKSILKASKEFGINILNSCHHYH